MFDDSFFFFFFENSTGGELSHLNILKEKRGEGGQCSVSMTLS